MKHDARCFTEHSLTVVREAPLEGLYHEKARGDSRATLMKYIKSMFDDTSRDPPTEGLLRLSNVCSYGCVEREIDGKIQTNSVATPPSTGEFSPSGHVGNDDANPVVLREVILFVFFPASRFMPMFSLVDPVTAALRELVVDLCDPNKPSY